MVTHCWNGIVLCLGTGSLTPELVLFIPHAWELTFVDQRTHGFEVSKDSFGFEVSKDSFGFEVSKDSF